MSFFPSSTPAALPAESVNELIRQVALAEANLRAAREHLRTGTAELREHTAAAEWVAMAEQQSEQARNRLADETGIKRTASGSWAEPWPEAKASDRQRYLERRGHHVRVERRGSTWTLLYQADALELLVTGLEQARVRAAAEVRG